MSDQNASNPTPSRSRVFRGVWTLMEGDRLRYGLALASLLAAAGMLYLIPLVPQAIIDVVLGDESEKASSLSNKSNRSNVVTEHDIDKKDPSIVNVDNST